MLGSGKDWLSPDGSRAVFEANLAGPGAGPLRGIWARGPDGTRKIVVDGDRVNGREVTGVGNAVINSAGDVVYRARIDGSGVGLILHRRDWKSEFLAEQNAARGTASRATNGSSRVRGSGTLARR